MVEGSNNNFYIYIYITFLLYSFLKVLNCFDKKIFFNINTHSNNNNENRCLVYYGSTFPRLYNFQTHHTKVKWNFFH